MTATRWVIHCRVSGGVTGTRETYLKANGHLQYFATEAEAAAKAKALTATMNGPYATADFRYRAEPADGRETGGAL